MATTAPIAASSDATPQTAPVSIQQPQAPNYLQRCVIELNPEAAASHEWDSFVYNGLSNTTWVGYIGLSVITFLAVGVYAPIYLPIIGFSAVVFLHPVNMGRLHFSNISHVCQQRADQLKAIAQEHQSLPNNGWATAIKLQQMNVTAFMQIPGIRTIDDLTNLNPLIARLEYWRKRQASYDEETNTLTAQASALLEQAHAENITEDEQSLKLEKLGQVRQDALLAYQNALICKTNAAFVHAVIQRPDFAGNLGSLAEFDGRSLEQRALDRRFNDPTADNFIVFKNRSLQPVTLTELQDNAAMPVHQLAQRFVQSIGSAAA